MSLVMPNIHLVFPELFVLAMTCIVLLVSVFVKKHNLNIVFWLTQITVVVSVIISRSHVNMPHGITAFHDTVVVDHLALVTKFATYFIAFFAFVYARTEIKQLKMHAGEYYSLALFSMLGMMVLVSANNLLTFYLGLELLSLPLYALVAFNRKSALGAEAAMKYFVTGALASGLLLFGMSLIYGASQHFGFTEIAASYHAVDNVSEKAQHIIMLTGIALVLAGMAFKLGLAPFHMWVPDVYQGAPVSIALFISSVPKIATLAIAVRFLFVSADNYQGYWHGFLVFLVLISIAWGNLAAIAQTNIKRLFAYSSVAHMGYMMLGVVAGTAQGLGASMFYVVTYAISAAGAFGLLIVLNRGGYNVEDIEDLNGLNAKNPWLAFLMLLLLFSMAGIPPLVGFVAKLSVMMALIKAHMTWLAIYSVVFAVVACFYYLRVVKVMYFENYESPALSTPAALAVAITVNGLAVLLLGIFPNHLLSLTHLSFV